MKQNILKCNKCKTYTLKEKCPTCNSKTTSPKPPKFSPEDKFGYWRRKAKKNDLENKTISKTKTK
ncbi:ribosome biogenesis protein [archaeon]|nr:ribosome biogenesis protein [archaeon]